MSLGVDVYMLVRLRRTLDEKLKREKDMNQVGIIQSLPTENFKTSNTKKPVNDGQGSSSKTRQPGKTPVKKKEKDLKNAMNNAIRMVVTNSLLNIVFKFPLCIPPIFNLMDTIAQHVQAQKYLYFLGVINRICVILFLTELSDFLFLILISIQFFIYIRFDHKIKAGFKRVYEKTKE